MANAISNNETIAFEKVMLAQAFEFEPLLNEISVPDTNLQLDVDQGALIVGPGVTAQASSNGVNLSEFKLVRSADSPSRMLSRRNRSELW